MKRLRASERVEMTLSPRRMSSSQSVGSGWRVSRLPKLPAMDLMGVSELNNSLTPIKSIAGSLGSLLTRHPLPTDWEDDMRRGLSVISTRSEALSRFIGAYARLAKLPRPQLESMEIRPWVQRVVSLETRLNVAVRPGPDIYIHGDPDQLEQVLINLLRNAADASLITGGGVHVGWTRNGSHVEVAIEDEGPGISNTTNLFVPFFT